MKLPGCFLEEDKSKRFTLLGLAVPVTAIVITIAWFVIAFAISIYIADHAW